MAKKRVYELAKELNVDAKDILGYLNGDLTSSSGIEDEDAEKVRKHFSADKKETSSPKSENAAEGAPKKKKPVLLFRPENSSYNQKKPDARKNNTSSGSRAQQGNRPQQSDRKNTGNSSRNEDPMRRSIIRPSVPTTAEQYKDMTKPEAAQVKAEVKPAEAPKAVEAPKAAETPKTAAPKVEAPKEEAPKAVEAPKTEAPKEEAPKAVETPKAEAPKEEAPRAVEAPKAEAPKAAEVKPAAPQRAMPNIKGNIFTDKPKENVYANTGASAQNGSRKPQERNGQGTGDTKRHKIIVDNRNKNDNGGRNQEGGYNRQNNGFRREGGQYQNRDGQYQNRNGQTGQNRGDRPAYNNQNGGNRRPFNQNGPQGSQNRFMDKDKDAQQTGRGGFNRNGQGQGQGRNFGPRKDSGAAASAGTLAKSDVRGKKNTTGTQHEKSRQDRDRTGRKEENFKNLSKGQNVKKPAEKKVEEQIKMIVLPEVISIKDLADKMKQKPADLIKKLFLTGKMVTLNTELPYEEAEAIALEYDILCEQEVKVDVIEELLREEDESEELMVKRPPVVCVMGHVDHGKTSLLDAIRSTNVTAREAGGITQHIGAYMVDCNGEKITFLDTPGHEAFTAMRMRGAQSTDIAILVVAADDGVMPQTVEAINHAKAAGVEIIVAVNKIDKPAANIERVKQELTEYELIAEDWGGSTIFVPVSAKTGEGIDKLLEMVLLVTEVQELKANPNREMRGIVIEAKLDKGRGPVATVLVQKGTLKTGQMVSAGAFYGRVRAMLDAEGNTLKEALPSTPVEILGLNGVPNAGEVAIGHKNEKTAREYAETFIAEQRKEMLAETKAKLTMDSLFQEIQAGNVKELPLIVKADVQGSVEAVKQSLEKITNEEVSVKVIHAGVGAINESDITLASASNAIVIGFNVRPDTQAKQVAEAQSVDVRLYRVIYQAIEDIENAMKGMLAPVFEEKVLGHAEVRQTFKASGVGVIAGSYVLDGTFERGCQIRVTRDKDLIFEGNMASLKRFKDDVKEVREGFECGIVCEKFNDLQEGDLIEAYKMVQVERK